MDCHEYQLTSTDGTPLFVRASVCPGQVNADAILTHGRGEHSRRYGHVGAAMATRGLRLITYDLRGHGRSGGRRGDLVSYEALLDDLNVVYRDAQGQGRPIFLMGHSLGGQITLNFLEQRQPSCAGAVITSPYLRLAFAPSRWRVALATAARYVWPAFTQNVPLASAELSRDAAHLESFPDLDLLHHRISSRMYHYMNRGAVSAMESAPKLQIPLLLIHGAADAVTSLEATREFFERAGSRDKTLSIYPGMRHETHNDLGREQVIAEIVEWIERRSLEGVTERKGSCAPGDALA